MKKWDDEQKEKLKKKEIEKIKKQIDDEINEIKNKELKSTNKCFDKPILKSLLNYAIETNNNPLVKKMLLEKILIEYYKDTNEKINNGVGTEIEIEIEKKEDGEDEDKENEDEDEDEDNDGEETIKFVQRLKTEIINLTNNEIENKMENLKFEYALFKAYHQQFFSALKNLLAEDYLQALLELISLKKRINNNYLVNPKLMFDDLISICENEIFKNTFEYLNKDLNEINEESAIKYLDSFQIGLISYQLKEFNSQILDKEDSLFDFLFNANDQQLQEETNESEKTKFDQLQSSLEILFDKFQKNEKKIFLKSIESLLDLLKNPFKLKELEIPTPNLSKFKENENSIYKDFFTNYQLVLKKYDLTKKLN